MANDKTIIFGEGLGIYPIPIIKKDNIRHFIENSNGEIVLSDADFDTTWKGIESIVET